MTVSPVDFLRARLAEEERSARWVLDCPHANYSAEWSEPSSGIVETGDDQIATGDSTLSRHIIRWDPARVLAEVAAKRVLLDLHQPQVTRLVAIDHGQGYEDITPDSFEEIVGRDVACMACAGFPPAPCRTLLLLAAPYRGRPGFDERWAL